MHDIFADVEKWIEAGETIALATVIQTWGSSPRKAGSKMAFTTSGKLTGSVSGGCVENAVVMAGMEALQSNHPQLLHFGVADETAWEVGLACGGSIDIFVQPLVAEVFHILQSAIASEMPLVHATVIRGAETLVGCEVVLTEKGIVSGSLGNEWDAVVLNSGIQALMQGASVSVQVNEATEVFFDVILPPPTLVMVGGVHIAVALVSLAKTLGYRTVVVDPRHAWASSERFPHVDELVQEWVDKAFKRITITRTTAIAMLTHDPKLDDPAVKAALNSPAFYVGALGSKVTNAKRRERLLREGLSEEQLTRLHAPIGLDIGAGTPEEIALAIMSEVVKSFRKPKQMEAQKEA